MRGLDSWAGRRGWSAWLEAWRAAHPRSTENLERDGERHLLGHRRNLRWRLPALLACLALAACGGSDDAGPAAPEIPAEPQAPPTPAVAPEAVAWLNEHAAPFESSLPDSDPSELEFLREMVGDARVVALGEATHGTKEFFQMKHRILRFLVREMGFDAFAMEATWPEMNRIDRFVRTGEGDPDVLLSGQYFWTWNTREVFDMMLWVRDHNRGLAPAEQVGFLGFDMQFPGMGIHDLTTYLDDVDPELLRVAQKRVACIVPFANGPDGSFDRRDYADQSHAVIDACRADLDALFRLLVDRRDDLVAASAEDELEHALQSLRVVVQLEDLMSNRHPGARDYHMARNTLWLLDRLGPDGKLVIWAHNGHVTRDGLAQGSVLKQELGDDYVDFDTPATAWLAGPRAFREIGCCANTHASERHVFSRRLPRRFEVVIHFTETTASLLPPFRLPPAFWF